jgi:hypothetical protein
LETSLVQRFREKISLGYEIRKRNFLQQTENLGGSISLQCAPKKQWGAFIWNFRTATSNDVSFEPWKLP